MRNVMRDKLRALTIRLGLLSSQRKSGRRGMSESSDGVQVSPEEIRELIERAAREPGLNDLLALARLSDEIAQDNPAHSGVAPVGCAQVAGTADWIL
jgi:hypothetical protein